MTWRNEANRTIKFTSPQGKEFEPLWRENERTFEKQLGVFDAPGVKKSLVQDLESKSVQYPLTVYFQGYDHYAEANDFFKRLFTERGQWAVIHPTKGFLSLQLVSCKEKIAPMSTGNYTEFDTTWIEPGIAERVISLEELLAAILTRALNAIDDAVTQLQQLRADLYAAVTSVLNTINAVMGIVDNILAEIAALDSMVSELYEEAKNTLNNALDAFADDPSDPELVADLAEALADLVSVPVSASTDFSTRFSAYSSFADEVAGLAPEYTTPVDYNQVLAQELSISSLLIAVARVVATSSFTTRSQVVSAIDNLTTIFNSCVAALDDVQEQFSALDIDLQYYSQSAAYGSLQALFATCIKYLMSQFYSLAAEKRFTLARERSPLEITVTEYGSLDYYDLFLTSNNLSGNDILLLPAGREVVIYAQ